MAGSQIRELDAWDMDPPDSIFVGRCVEYRYRLVNVNCSQVLAAARFATSTLPMFRSADTYWLLASACSATVPLLCAIRRNFSVLPIAVRLAISCPPRVESAVT